MTNKDVVILSPTAVAAAISRQEYSGDPNEIEQKVIRARYEGKVPNAFWTVDHHCPLCDRTMDAFTFVAHAGMCINEKMPRDKLYLGATV